MQPDNFLHDLKDFPKLIRAVSHERRIQLQLIEKDYWIMHALYGLTQQGFTFVTEGWGFFVKGLPGYRPFLRRYRYSN